MGERLYWAARSSASAVALSLSLLLARPVRAEVIEPNSVAVPLNSNNGETQLSTLFTDRGEVIDFIADGSATPDTFSPLCGFQATFVLKQAGSSLGVGWYNADPARTAVPLATEVHEIVPAGSPVGTVVTGADIRGDGSYAGGSIGFALIKSPLHFTEARYNTVCTFCSTPGPWVLSVSYQSTELTNAYYVAFEDGNTDALTWSNDGDFNDYVFLFEGLSCVGEGAACEVPDAKGVCLPGVQECDAGGVLVCKSSIEPSDEVCDALDNDCDGSTDEENDGAALCQVGQVCSRGQCVPRCGDTEFLCTGDRFTLCEDGLCIEPACAGTTCAEGQACIGGECRAPCDGVICPLGRVCQLGACVDPCAGVTCEGERVCSAGACVLSCTCAGCAADLGCDVNSGLCVDEGCQTQTCGSAERCVQGACEDACEGAAAGAGARCPTGSTCTLGECVPMPIGDAGVSMGMGSDAGVSGASAPPPASLGDDAGTAMTPGAGSGGAQSPRLRSRMGEAAGCGCHVAGRSVAPGALTWLTFTTLLGLCLRTRGRRQASTRSDMNGT